MMLKTHFNWVMQRTVVAFCIFALSALSTAPQVAAQTVVGGGMISCGEWLRLRSAEDKGGSNYRDLAANYQLRAWIDGFLSGANVGSGEAIARDPRKPDFLSSHPDGASLYAFVDNYCRSKPLNLIVQAAEALMKELQSRQRRPN